MYSLAATAGYSNIRTAHEFARGGSDKTKYGTYQKYLDAMYKKYVIDGTPGPNSNTGGVGKVTTPAKTMHKVNSTETYVYESRTAAPNDEKKVVDGKTYYKINGKWWGSKVTGTTGYSARITYSEPYEYYDTGGYTGEWGPDGKLAVLHEKELVLNKEDTENFLTATQTLREISGVLDHSALIASLGAIDLTAMTIGTTADQILQQEVTIHADFPNVVDHNEIEIAIDNLINAASQHAFKS